MNALQQQQAKKKKERKQRMDAKQTSRKEILKRTVKVTQKMEGVWQERTELSAKLVRHPNNGPKYSKGVSEELLSSICR